MRLIRRSGWKSVVPKNLESRAKSATGPWAVECRVCGASIGKPCVNKQGLTARSHTIRRHEASHKRPRNKRTT